MDEHEHMKPDTHPHARTRYGHACTRSHTGTMIPFPGELESTTDEGNWYELHYSDTIPGTVLQPDPRSAAPYCNDYAGTFSTLSEGMMIRSFLLY